MVVGGGGGDGAAGVELVDEHGLDHEPEGHLGVLDGVHEERRGERGAIDGVAYFGFLIRRYFPAIFLHNSNTKMAFKILPTKQFSGDGKVHSSKMLPPFQDVCSVRQTKC